MKNQKNGHFNTQIERYCVIKIRPSFKTQKIIKQRSPSRQLFETINFAFMNFFDFLVKIAIFKAFLLFSERFSSRISARIKCLSRTVYGNNAWRKSPEKRRNVLKMAVLTIKSKIFIKAKLTASKSCLLGLVYFMICCILRDVILLSMNLLKFQSLEFQIF